MTVAVWEALTYLAEGNALHRRQSGWYLYPRDRALPVRVTPATVRDLLAAGWIERTKASRGGARYRITEAGRAQVPGEETQR